MNYHRLLFLVYILVLIWSVINPLDYFTWMLEIFPAIAGLAILILTYRKFRFTDVVYTLILLHCCILFVGGHYTYARVPLFEWLRPVFHWQRNNYDKLGHFAQGFVPAFIARELYIRRNIVRPGAWTAVLTVATCLSISLLYELFEWVVALASGQNADAFLGTQGDPWDTQSDMAFALLGALCMVFLFAGMHNRMIARLASGEASRP
ncbi:MAG TPA: DUF2238 domain-containing protein [Bacteroidota bacterium]|nr:DUF2238 domain-containing protein [Bacteroidota bacterium]